MYYAITTRGRLDQLTKGLELVMTYRQDTEVPQEGVHSLSLSDIYKSEQESVKEIQEEAEKLPLPQAKPIRFMGINFLLMEKSQYQVLLDGERLIQHFCDVLRESTRQKIDISRYNEGRESHRYRNEPGF